MIAWRWLPDPEVMAEILRWKDGWVDPTTGQPRQISKESALLLLDEAMRTKFLDEVKRLCGGR